VAKKLAIPFQIYYTWDGAKRRYIPEFLIKLANGKTLVLEINGEDNEQIRAKHPALGAWVWVKEVNSKGLACGSGICLMWLSIRAKFTTFLRQRCTAQ